MDKLEKRLITEEYSEQSRGESSQRNSVSQKNFSFDQYQAIIEGADSLQRLAAEKEKRKERILAVLPQEPRDKEVPLSRVYEFASQLGINGKYVDKYMKLRFPSAEQQLQDVRKHMAIYSEELSIEDELDKSRRNIANLLDGLKTAFPQENFEMKRINFLDRLMEFKGNFFRFLDYNYLEKYVFYRKDNQITISSIFKRKKLKKVKFKIASVSISYQYPSSLHVDLYDPSFIRACDSELEEMKKRDTLSLTYHYKIKS